MMQTMTGRPSKLTQAIQDTVPQIIALMDNTRHEKLWIATKIEELCIEAGLAYLDDVKPWESGVHENNRFGSGVDPFDVHGLLDTFIDDSFSYKLAKNHSVFEKTQATRKCKNGKSISTSSCTTTRTGACQMSLRRT